MMFPSSMTAVSVAFSVVSLSFASVVTVQPVTFIGFPSLVFALTLMSFLSGLRVRNAPSGTVMMPEAASFPLKLSFTFMRVLPTPTHCTAASPVASLRATLMTAGSSGSAV